MKSSTFYSINCFILNEIGSSKPNQTHFNYFNALRPDYHSLHLLPEYGHLDVFMGKNAAVDTFPLIIAELNKS